MIYDAIINGARSLAFYGGNIPVLERRVDSAHGWNWTFWNTSLKSLIAEISAISPIAPGARRSPRRRTSCRRATRRRRRSAASGSAGDLWVIAARSGTGTSPVTIWACRRPCRARRSTPRPLRQPHERLVDGRVRQWGVHVYHLVPPDASAAASRLRRSARSPRRAAPSAARVAITGTEPRDHDRRRVRRRRGRVHRRVRHRAVGDRSRRRCTGPISVTTPCGTAVSPVAFTATAPTPPRRRRRSAEEAEAPVARPSRPTLGS